MSLKICAVGCGNQANATHGPAYARYAAENPDAAFVACCDIDAAKAEAFRAKYGFARAYTDMEEMLRVERPDAVTLMSPVHMTAILAEKILERGIPLLLEKPPGRNREEVMRLVDAARKKNVSNRVAFNRRYAPLIRMLKGLLPADPARIQSVQYDMFRVNRPDEDFSTTAIHAIDAAKFIAGSDYKRVRFCYREYPELGRGVADIHMMCEMQSGTVMQLNICPVTGIVVESAVVNLHDETFLLDYLGNALNPAGRLTRVQKKAIALDITGRDLPDGLEPFEHEGFYFENKSFFDDIIAGRAPSGGLATAVQSVEVADCIRNRLPEYTANPM